jgi:endoglucanase
MSVLESGAIYSIQAKNSGKYIAVSDASRDNGARLVQWDWTGGNEQKWRVTELGNDIYTFQALNSGKYMDVSGNFPDNGKWVIQYDLNQNGAPNQQFQLIGVTPGDYHLKMCPLVSGKRVAVERGYTNNGAKIIQWDDNGGDEQQFLFSKL